MSALPAIEQQLSLLEPSVQTQTKVCDRCGIERKVGLFAWADKTHTARKAVCNVCENSPRVGSGESAPPNFRRSRSKVLTDAPYLPAIDPQPVACWMKAGDVIPVLLNNEGADQVVVGYFTVVSVTNNATKLRKQGGYTALRNRFVQRGYQIMELRKSIAAALIERTARNGR